ncbi:MAG TPA: DUF4326 domain-containing protein [Burkholderiales bacterium]
MATAPRRIQRQRIKGWRMPANTIYVGRPSRWGNPFGVRCAMHGTDDAACDHLILVATPALAVERYRQWARNWRHPSKLLARLPELRGKNLACWCRLDQPCHADVLLELANQPQEPLTIPTFLRRLVRKSINQKSEQSHE